MENGYVYRNFTKEALDEAYDNSKAVKNSNDLLGIFYMRSAKLATNFQDTLDLRYGRHPRETLDYFSCGKRNAPLFVFIHGGYWQMRNKEMFRFVASGPLAHGFDVANIGYPLAPDRDMRGIIASLRSAFSYLRLHNDDLGFDASHIYVSGWSAGAHLAVNMLDERGVCGALAISGIYDLEPISKSYLNDKLQLTESEILLFSPLRKPFVKKSVVVVVGADELPLRVELPADDLLPEDLADALAFRPHRRNYSKSCALRQHCLDSHRNGVDGLRLVTRRTMRQRFA